MPARILLGTASWADKPLIDSGKFYPPSAKDAEGRLRFYATQFPLVEADSTYYGLPAEPMTRAWVERTPEGFTFDVKAYSLFTDHPSPIARLPREIREQLPPDLAEKKNLYRKDAPRDIIDQCWATFVDALAPVHRAGKLGVVVFQLPKWVFPGRQTTKMLEDIRHRLGDYRGAVEFRNDRWMQGQERENTLSLLGDLGFTYICVDEPQGFSSSVPPIAAATAPLGFVRFHGRNTDTWEKRTATSAERFDYWYGAEELGEWVAKIESLARETDELHLVMNTNAADQGPANLRLLAETLSGAGIAMAQPPA